MEVKELNSNLNIRKVVDAGKVINSSTYNTSAIDIKFVGLSFIYYIHKEKRLNKITLWSDEHAKCLNEEEELSGL